MSKEQQQKIIDTNRDRFIQDDWYLNDLETISELIKENVGLNISPKDIKFEIGSRSNSIWIDLEDLNVALTLKYTFEELDLPNKFGCYCNYLGGGICSSLMNSEIKDGFVQFYVEEGEELEDLMKEKLTQLTTEKMRKDLISVQNILSDGYNGLYKSYEYYQSDEFIKEEIELNEMEFEKDE